MHTVIGEWENVSKPLLLYKKTTHICWHRFISGSLAASETVSRNRNRIFLMPRASSQSCFSKMNFWEMCLLLWDDWFRIMSLHERTDCRSVRLRRLSGDQQWSAVIRRQRRPSFIGAERIFRNYTLVSVTMKCLLIFLMISWTPVKKLVKMLFSAS